MRARLARYSLWQFRDFFMERGLPSLIVAALMLFPVVAGLHDRAPDLPDAQRALVARGALATVLNGPLGFVIVLLAVNGIVSTDRRQGYYRFLFAKPLAIPRYYAQSFAVNLTGAIAVTAVVVVGFGAAVHPIAPGGALAFVALYYLALGGIMFLVSTVTRLDWVVTAAIWALAQLLRGVFPAERGWYGRLLDVVLPPAHRVGDVGRVLLDDPMRLGDPSLLTSVLWLAGWGGAAFIAGLVVLRKRSMGA